MVVFMADMYACMIRRREDRIGGDDDDVRQSDAAAGRLVDLTLWEASSPGPRPVQPAPAGGGRL